MMVNFSLATLVVVGLICIGLLVVVSQLAVEAE
jgi:hypothetical protein